MFKLFRPYLGDPILSLLPRFQNDPRPEKVNLGIGLYFDETGVVPILDSVRQMLATRGEPVVDLSYLPMAGDTAYRQVVQELLFGQNAECIQNRRVSTIQTLGGTGGLKVGADVLHHNFPTAEVWICDPTWDNHVSIFAGAGFQVHRYPYFDAANGCVDFAALSETLSGVSPHSVVLFHACCHNPTGADLSHPQRDALIEIIRAQRLIPFFDFAYQGFGQGLDEDCYAIRAMANAGISFLVANSFSKNFGLYGERCGALSFVCQDASEAECARGQMELAVRQNYSSPPRHGARIITGVLKDTLLRKCWAHEVEAMRLRLASLRQGLCTALQERSPDHDFSYLLKQAGMFCFIGLDQAMVDQLRKRFAIYAVGNGRLCLAGLRDNTIEHVAHAIIEVRRASPLNQKVA